MSSPESLEARRAAAKRTAWWVAGIALGFYVLFIVITGQAAA